MPLPTSKQRTAARSSIANRSISPPLRRSSTPTGIKKNRFSATNRQRAELRRWWADKSLGKREHKDAIRWFEEKFGPVLSTSTISDYLSLKFAGYRYSDGALLKALRRFERDLAERYQDSLQQATLDKFWNR
jgi:hypothetical protein